jgi:hypothetical protein
MLNTTSFDFYFISFPFAHAKVCGNTGHAGQKLNSDILQKTDSVASGMPEIQS